MTCIGPRHNVLWFHFYLAVKITTRNSITGILQPWNYFKLNFTTLEIGILHPQLCISDMQLSIAHSHHNHTNTISPTQSKTSIKPSQLTVVTTCRLQVSNCMIHANQLKFSYEHLFIPGRCITHRFEVDMDKTVEYNDREDSDGKLPALPLNR